MVTDMWIYGVEVFMKFVDLIFPDSTVETTSTYLNHHLI